MKKFINWIPYMAIISIGMCYTLGFPLGIGPSIAIGAMIGMTVDLDKKRRLEKE
ncbi:MULTISPECIES: hypothetical protein [Staphylococcus]|uniref:hypothetical protein n=1 Tax=Staphylococcus TaxID=1279 RepID=UPI000267E144|nr:hypothetical protein [Staphylococcus equorum]ALM55847.1 hypothetical protein SE1039_00640 [Staphylococcus equorum]MCE5048462.1 hypothetical protein [Staphylococcus equorum]MCM3072572.1 hypothetical protein [Staphylococcus equorum]MDG0825799.1 hypothetical protein [Staphylococcus equorum]MDK9846714.1 hypothetical protein [Staphylococcus equorum]